MTDPLDSSAPIDTDEIRTLVTKTGHLSADLAIQLADELDEWREIMALGLMREQDLKQEVDRLREDNEKLKTAVNQLGHEVSDGYNKIDRYRLALEKIETTISLGPELLALKRTKKIAREALAGEERT